MDTKEINEYEKAAAVWKSTLKLARKEAKDGVPLLSLAQKIEANILKEGCGIAFPVNLSLNEEAAHFTPKYNDERTLQKSDLLKIDIGVHSNGYICDGAISINLDNSHAKQIEANELALENAISVVALGKTVEIIGAEIERTLKEKGFNPIYNLGGHGLEKNNIHSSPGIPNHKNGSEEKIEEGAIAIEPFASTGKGFIGESAQVEIFAMGEKKGVRNTSARKIIELSEKYETLPFAERWLRKDALGKINDFQFTFALKEIMKLGIFENFPGLKETKGNFVSQTEKSLLVLEDKVIVLGE